MKTAIRLNHVTKEFSYWSDRPTSMKTLLVDAFRLRSGFGKRERFCALEDINFTINEGEFVGIMGRNGAGKSTLLKLISKIYIPTTGSVEVSSQVAPLIELGAGFHPDLSGYENIFLNAAILGFGRKATQMAVGEIVEFAELGEKIYMPIRNYSSGMLVRLGFSIASHLTAPVILIDEVLAVGDAGFQKKCLEKIHELHSEGRTIILITHSVEAVEKNCDRCIVINDKKVIFDGSTQKGVEFYEKVVH